MSGILAYALHYEGAYNKNSLGGVSEAARLAQQAGCEAHAVVIGDVSDELAAQLGTYGVTKVFRAADVPEGLAQPVVDVMAKVMDDNGHDYALFGGGLLGFEIGAGLAARLNAGVTMEVTKVNVVDGRLQAERPIHGDSSISTSSYKDRGIVIGRLNAFETAVRSDATAEVEDVEIELSPFSTKATMIQRGEARGEDVDIEAAGILVAGGRGLGKPEGFEVSSGARRPRAPSAARSPRRAPSSTPAGTRTRRRSARPARPCRRSSTSPPASPARSSTRSASSPRRTSSRSTRTPTHRSSSTQTSASSATSTRSCPS
jgi:electron transfer flavoprotein alpha subunit